MLLQPSYMPWIGFFEQTLRCDLFVAFDDAQYTKGDWRNRNRIRTRDGRVVYLTVPLERAPTQTEIRAVRIANLPWEKKHGNLLRAHYGHHPFFDAYFPAIERILHKKHLFLLDLNLELIEYFHGELKIRCEVVRNSQLTLPERGKQRLLGVSRHFRAAQCYNGAAGKSLYRPEDFRRHGVELLFQNFECPEYPQGGFPFVPNLSILDLLFHVGPASRGLIEAGGRMAALPPILEESRCG